MSKLQWNLWDDLKHFDMGESGARPAVWRDRKALYFESDGISPVLLHDDLQLDCFRLQAEVAVPGPYGFAGLVFGARDSKNFELVYISPGIDSEMGQIQYDPVMNGSSTWQIYHGPVYQADAPVPAGEWVKLRLEVQQDSVAICVGDTTTPQIVVPSLQLGRPAGRIGVWGCLPSYIRNFSAEHIQPAPIDSKRADLKRLENDTFVTEWMFSEPYTHAGTPNILHDWTKAVWTKATVEENGTLNLNRMYPAAEKGTCVQTKYMFSLSVEKESLLTFGFSDQIRLWINEQEVYQGEWLWDPPGRDGRIRSEHAAVPIRWRAGLNIIRAELTNLECMFGWGLSMKTGIGGG